ncbi:hypothetical protein IE53DRAFT_27477 [Violaceomyces palustris]|uniref:Uncharacterized protein n=1 Tax=Violaceomyces palustris TaxID=1673888 RepID=A0ACD0P1T1_9BASI|nr:hypothetical protein IE53DRAFT_27477 [Violaceomyces palustris]
MPYLLNPSDSVTFSSTKPSPHLSPSGTDPNPPNPHRPSLSDLHLLHLPLQPPSPASFLLLHPSPLHGSKRKDLPNPTLHCSTHISQRRRNQIPRSPFKKTSIESSHASLPLSSSVDSTRSPLIVS